MADPNEEREVLVASCPDDWALEGSASDLERLASARIAEVLDDAGLRWSAFGRVGGATYYVAARDAERAKRVLREAEARAYIPAGSVWPDDLGA